MHVRDVTADEWAFHEKKAEGEVPLLSQVVTASRTWYSLHVSKQGHTRENCLLLSGEAEPLQSIADPLPVHAHLMVPVE
jgi:hypothetical protein